MSPAIRRKRARSTENSVQEPAMRTGGGILTITGSEDPETRAGFILDAEIIPHRGQLGITFPPFSEDPLWPIRPSDMMADAFPGEPVRGMIRQERHVLDRLRPGEEARRTWPVIRPARAGLFGKRRDAADRTFGNIARNRGKAIDRLRANPVCKPVYQ